ncbi:acetate/propionate family kinase [Piscirickettsia salmonis]|uniref:acetate/propionate family kinase n=1 Tax=Piscirickettsia salmonis TaxID=1238 RepID=UPI0018ACB77B|nr:acetate/propionate family kinase [Piscirickettsia salmonis]QGP54015.1 Acetate kinase [Piscirickettsia salmonis]QGP60086.1 Acetate kinase [Piscirickettsia salmonis]
MLKTILTLNAGSSSLKFSVYTLYHSPAKSELKIKFSGQVNGLGTNNLSMEIQASSEDGENFTVHEKLHSQPGCDQYTLSLNEILHTLQSRELIPDIVGHRVVHGGNLFECAIKVNKAILQKLEELIPLAPLHQPYNLQEIKIVEKTLPEVFQVACFDTAFHQSIPEFRKYYALPHTLYKEGIKRYGFHGLSYQYIASQLPEVLEAENYRKVVVAHLGSGASLCGLIDLKSHVTTMGFTALDGLPMATRCGQLDPGVVLYLAQHKKMTNEQIEDTLYHQSGILGLAEGYSDLASLFSSEQPKDRWVVDYYVDQIVMHITSVIGALGGIDALVFTGGVGENSPRIRRAVCAQLSWLELKFNDDANQRRDLIISQPESHIKTLVMKTDEEKIIAEQSVKSYLETINSSIQDFVAI